MFCLTTKNQVSPDNIEQLTRFIKEQWVPLASRQRGLKGTYFMTKPDGEFLMMSLWDSEEQIRAWLENSEHKQLGAQVKPLFTGTPVQDVFEVQDWLVT